jgi:hypothetical protein
MALATALAVAENPLVGRTDPSVRQRGRQG